MRYLAFASAVFAVGAAKSTASCGKSEFYGKTAVVDLCDSHFPDKSSEHVWMVEFYAPWCGHCKALKPKFIDAAKKAKKDAEFQGIKFGAVDCTKEQSLCQKYDVKGYPTLKAFVGGKAREFRGQRETEDMLQFMAQLKDSKGTKGGSSKCASSLIDASKQDAIPLCASHFPDKKSKNNWVIVFHSKEIEKKTSKDLYVLASKVSSGGAKLGVVDCSTDAAFCKTKLGSELESTIAIKTFLKGKSELSGESFSAADLSDTGSIVSFVKKELGAKFKVPTSENDEL